MFTLCTASFIVAAVSALPTSIAQKMAYHTERIKYNFDGTLISLDYAALLCSAANNDTFKDMLRQPDAKNFVQAMMDELKAHDVRNHWSLMLGSDLPAGTKKILSIWYFKRKRSPDVRILKYKARICTHGGIQT